MEKEEAERKSKKAKENQIKNSTVSYNSSIEEAHKLVDYIDNVIKNGNLKAGDRMGEKKRRIDSNFERGSRRSDK